MTTALISVSGALAGAVAMVLVYFASKKHKEKIEDQGAETSHITAISAASETLAEAVNVLIEPLNRSITRLQEQEREMAIEMTKVKAELAIVKAEHRRLNQDLESLVRYAGILWWQIKEHGIDPEPVPVDITHIIWFGDKR
jgi:hypothetical protein